MPQITSEAVGNAAEALIARGEKPSVRKIREELGGGSPNAILPLLNAWRDSRQNAVVTVSAPLEEDIDLPPEAVRLLNDLRQSMASAMVTLLRTERANSITTQKSVQQDADARIARVQKEMDRRLADIEARAATQLQDARDEAQSLAEQLATAEADVGDLRARLQVAEERASAADADRRRSAELHAEQMRQIEAAHRAIDDDRRDQMRRLEAKLSAANQELRALKDSVLGAEKR